MHLRTVISIGVSASVATMAAAGQWSVVASFQVPEGASGLAFDGEHLYCGIYGVDGGHVYRIDPATGDTALAFIGQHEDAFGLTYDAEAQLLWTTDHPGSSSTPAQALQLHWDGSVVQAIDLPDHYMSGIAWAPDSNTLWTARYYEDPGHLYHVDLDGTVLHQFDYADDQPWDIAVDGTTLWVADYWGDALYQLDAQTGSVLRQHASEDIDPAGVVWDGTHLWYVDNGGSWDYDTLYKVDIAGGGAAAIMIDDLEHDFGVTTIGQATIWHLDVNNTGTAPLVIDAVSSSHEAVSCISSLPLEIDPGTSTSLILQYAPEAFGAIDTTATVHSNDPVHSEVDLAVHGHGVHAGPVLHVNNDAHFFSNVRLGASTRWFIELSNHGDTPLVVDTVTSSDAQFTLEVEVPLVIETLEVAHVGVWFTPASTTTTMSDIFLYSSDPTAPAHVLVGGAAVEGPWPIGQTLWSVQYTDDWDNSPKAIKPIADINSDGRSDVIVATEDNFIRCLHGNASGTADELWAHEIYAGSVYSDKGLFVCADVDGDSVQDVVVAATGGARLVRMLSGATGATIWTFHTNAVGGGGWVYQVDASRDFTGDGIVDVVACAGDDGDQTGPRRAYLLDGSSGWLIWQRSLGGATFASIAVDDFTGDGVPDVVAGASDLWETQGTGYGINGLTGQVEWSYHTAGSSVWGLAQLGDVTGDGVADVMLGDFSSGQLVAMDAVQGTAAYVTGVGALLTGIKVIGDVTGDGFPDVVPEYFGATARVVNGRTGTTVWSTPVMDNPTTVAPISDLTGDGVNDLIVGTLFSNNWVYAFDGVTGEEACAFNYGTPLDAVGVMPDVTGDASWEFLAGGRDGTLTCFSGGVNTNPPDPADVNGDGTVNVNDLLLVIGAWGSADPAADVNGDGIVDTNDILLVLSAWGPRP